jgi:GNAT superfamily N-acetyltransferase
VTALIRPAGPADVSAIRGLIRELAEYENALDQVEVTEPDLAATLFGPQPSVFAHVGEVDGAVAGFALWFLNYSTWTGRPGLYLEDLYVTPRLRRSGLGRALLAELAAICLERGYARLDWAVLDWNAPALEFYARLDAEPLDQWRLHRLSGPALATLGQAGLAQRGGGAPDHEAGREQD